MQRIKSTSLWLALGVAAALALGCGSTPGSSADAGAGPIDAGNPQPMDAAFDSGPGADANTDSDAAVPAPRGREGTPLSGHVSGGIYEMDFQLGHWSEQRSFSGGSTTGEGAAVIKP